MVPYMQRAVLNVIVFGAKDSGIVGMRFFIIVFCI